MFGEPIRPCRIVCRSSARRSSVRPQSPVARESMPSHRGRRPQPACGTGFQPVGKTQVTNLCHISVAAEGRVGSNLLRHALGVVVVGFLVCSSPGRAQTTKPVVAEHEALLKKIAKRPLSTPELKSAAGQPLSDAERADIDRGNKLMADAETARQKGDFATAAQKSKEASEIRQRLLGSDHYLTVSARVLTGTMTLYSGLDSDAQRKLAEADKRLAEATKLQKQGEYVKSAEAAKAAVSLREAVLPKDHEEIGPALLRLGSVQTDLADYDVADGILARSRQLVQKAYGAEHPEMALVLDRVGWLGVYQANQRGSDRAIAREAVSSLAGAVRIFQATVGETVEMAESLDNLATAQANIGNTNEALRNRLRALVIRKTLLGPEDKEVGVSLSNLAWMYGMMGKIDQALPLRRRAATIFENSLGARHPYTVQEKSGLAGLYTARGEYDEAIRLLESLVAIDREGASGQAGEGLPRRTRLGTLYLFAGRLEDADRELGAVREQAVALHAKGEGRFTSSSLQLMANTYQSLRMSGDAVQVYEKLVAWDDEERGQSDNGMLIDRASALGQRYLEVGRLDDAERMLLAVVDRIKKLHGDASIQMAVPLLGLATVYERRDELDRAAALCDEVLNLSEQNLPSNSRGTAIALMRVGRINAMQKRFEMARFSLEEAQRILKTRGEENSPLFIEVLHELGRCHGLLGEREKAVKRLKDALARCRQAAKDKRQVWPKFQTAKVLKALLDAAGREGPEAAAWRAELKTLLDEFKNKRSLNAEQQGWLKELGG